MNVRGAVRPVIVGAVLLVIILIAAVALSRSDSLNSSTGTSSAASSAISSASTLSSSATSSAASSTAQLGLQLRESINSSSIAEGQNLSVSISLTNTLPTINDIPTSNDWSFHGVAGEVWGACVGEYPLEVVILSGNYTAQELPSIANSTFAYTCAGFVPIDHVVFQPNSSEASVSGTGSEPEDNQTLGPFNLALNFTTSGYWNLQSLSKQTNPPLLGPGTTLNLASIKFVPGTYTVAVADEWGQTAIQHFTVTD